MFRFSTDYRQMLARSFLPLLAAVGITVCGAEELPFSDSAANLITNSIHWVTNVSQFRTLSSADYLAGWKNAATLVGMLLIILAVALLWIYLLRCRLERHQSAQLAFSQHVLRKLEAERRPIAANLHDSLGQTLLVIKPRAISATQALAEGEGIQNLLQEISSVTSQAIAEVRRITHGLRPYQLDRLGLTQAIRASVNQASENGTILFASRVENIDGLFDKDAEIHVYRIVQEAITNVVKHSAATEATVVIKKQPAAVSISIRDNGRGFDPAKLSSPPHNFGYGLSGIAERVHILKGTVVIDSRPAAGTSLAVEVPFKIS